VLLVALVVRWRVRRAATRRVLEIALRIEREHGPEGRGLDRAFERLARAADDAVLANGEAQAATDRLAQALGGVRQGILVCDENGQTLYRNEQAASLTGGRHSEALAERAVDELIRLALGGRPQKRTLELFGPPRRVLTVAATPLHDARRTIGAVALIDDITERRRLEAVRRDFVANISHELKTPVGALGLLAETMLAEDDAEVARRLAARMQNEAHRVGRIIDDLLDLSRIEAEETPRREPVAVHLVLAEAAERARAFAEHRGIGIVVAEPNRRLAVQGDRRQMVSAVHNLLENAVKYSDAGSTVDVGARTDGRHVEITVEDHGIGIPARDLERIFERFYRVDRARARDTGGTGLGLAIVRHVAGNHGGEVFVESKEGEGSTFTLRLPAASGPVALTAEAG
jgi:two-component system, OmpR family, sensor histidine kinase SenX3